MEDLLNYMGALVHLKPYRKAYKRLLRVDFEGFPIPESSEMFWRLTRFGEKLRKIYTGNFYFSKEKNYSGKGDDIVKFCPPVYCPENDLCGRVFFNAKQCFDRVPKFVWNFYITGAQPAQKWLRQHQGEVLDDKKINAYRKLLLKQEKILQIIQQMDQAKMTVTS